MDLSADDLLLGDDGQPATALGRLTRPSCPACASCILCQAMDHTGEDGTRRLVHHLEEENARLRGRLRLGPRSGPGELDEDDMTELLALRVRVGELEETVARQNARLSRRSA